MHYWRREASKNLWRLCSLEMRFFFIFFFTIIIFSFCFQGHRQHHVHSFLPYLHLSASGHLHRLLCHDSSVSFWLKLLSWGHAAQLNLTCKDWSLNWPCAVSVTVCFLNFSVLSFLSSSGNAVYKVTAVDDKCTYVDHTCNPKVSAYVTVFCCTAFDSRLESWTKHLKSTVVQYYFVFFCLRPSVRPTSPKCVLALSACSPSMAARVYTTATSWYFISATCLCSSGWSTSPSPWGSAPWLGPSRPTTGPWGSLKTFRSVHFTPRSAGPYGISFLYSKN